MDPISSDFLIDTLANTPFIMFLVWQFMISRRDYKELKKEAKEEQEKIRARFEAIIKDLNADRDSITTASLEKSIRKLFAVIDKLKESINDLKIKERIRDLT